MNAAEYQAWYARCDRLCQQISGVGIDDLPDGPSRDAFEDGVPPEEYVMQQLDEAGFPHEPDPPAQPRLTAGKVTVRVPLTEHQYVTAPNRRIAAEILVRKHGVTPAEAAKAAADA